MRICFVAQDMSIGGISTVISEVINNWNESDEIYLVLFFNNFDERYNFLRKKKNLKILFLEKTKTIDFKFFRKFSETINNICPSVISSHLTCVFYLKILGLTKKYKTYHTVHSEPSKDLPWVYRCFLNKDFKKGKISLIGCCDYITRKTSSLYKCKCITIQNAISTTADCSKDNDCKETRFLYVGRLDKIKNVYLLIEAFEKADTQNSMLVICGDGPEYKRISKRIDACSKKDKIILSGKNSNVVDFYKNADILCLISKREGLPITVLEGINYGLAFLVTNVGGISSFVKDGFNGVYVETNSLSATINGIEFYLTNPAKVRNYKCNSLLVKKDIDSKKMALEYQKVLYEKQ